MAKLIPTRLTRKTFSQAIQVLCNRDPDLARAAVDGQLKLPALEAKDDPVVETALGTPIEAGWFVMGNINISGSSGEADLAIPTSGPYDKATIYAVAEKSAGQWTFLTLVVKIKSTGDRIDLLQEKETYE
jgi:hypothetical protein